MASKSNVYAGVAGNAARPDQKGTVGVFARPAETGRWEHVLTGHETYTVNVHPTNPNVVFAGTADGVYRSTDRGKSFQRTNFPDKGIQIWSFLVDANDRKLVYAGGSPISMYRSEDTGETWRALPNPGMPDRAVMPFACRVMRMAQHPSQAGTIFAALEVNGVMRTDEWRRKLERLQHRPDPAGATAASEEQNRQRYLQRGHAGRPRHCHQPGRSRTR